MAGGPNELRESVLASGSRLLAMAGESAREPYVDDLRRRLDRLAGAEYRMVVCDGWRDKSPFLNAFVGRQGLFPPRAASDEYIVTLKWSEREYAVPHFAESDPEASAASLPVPIDSIPELAACPADGKVLSLVELGAPVALLKSGLVLTDIPGSLLGGPATQRAAREFLRLTDAMLFLVSSAERIDRSGIAFLSEALERLSSVTIGVVEEGDPASAGMSTSESLREWARASPLSPEARSRLTIVRVFLPATRVAGGAPIPEHSSGSGIAELRARVLERVADHNAAQLRDVLTAMAGAIDARMELLRREAAIVTADRGALERQLRLRLDEQARAEGEERRLMRELRAEVDRAARRAMAALDEHLADIAYRFLRIRALGMQSHSAVADELSDRMLEVANYAGEMLAHDLNTLADRYLVAPFPGQRPFPEVDATIGPPASPRALPDGAFAAFLGARLRSRLRAEAVRAVSDRDGSSQRTRVGVEVERVHRLVARPLEEAVRDAERIMAQVLRDQTRERRNALRADADVIRREMLDRESLIADREREMLACAALAAQVDSLRGSVDDLPPSPGRPPSGDAPSGNGSARPRATAEDRGAAGAEPALAAPGPERHLVGEVPARVRAGAEFSLLVSIVSGTPDARMSAAPMPPLAVGPAGVPVTFLVFPDAGLEVLAESQQTVLVPQHGDSAPARFAFRASAVGLCRVLVRAFLGGTHLAALRLEVSVEPSAVAAVSQRRGTPLGALDADPGEATLQVHFDGAQYSFQLLSHRCLYGPVLAKSLTEDPGSAVERTVAMLRKMAGGSSGYPPQLAARSVRENGVGLWRKLVPQAVQEQFWQLKDSITSFTIACDRDVVPWELLYPVAPGADAGFLVEQFPVLRRVYGQSRSQRLWLGDARYVIPPGPPANARGEVAAIRRILGQSAGPTIGDLAALLDLLDAEAAGMLHFTCHSSFSAEDGSSIAMAGGRFRPELLNSMAASRRLAARSPLVFINACQSARGAAYWSEMMSWASQFMTAGAGAFIGTLWPVRSSRASHFAEAFYSSLAAGGDLGHATLEARQAAKDDGDPTWLAYTVYGDPAASAVTLAP